MPNLRLSPLDASFLEVESATAHMHVGWAATFSPPEDAPRPSFEELRDHIGARLGRAPRYRQRRVPGRLELLMRAAGERAAQQARLLNIPLELLRAPRRVLELPSMAMELGLTLSRSLFPLAQPSALNRPSSPLRHLAPLRRPL